jgi:alpha-D-xyloside xylohydrolase
VLARYTALTGRPPVPPAWSFGLWLTTSFTTEYDEATVSRFVDGLAERQIPLGVFQSVFATHTPARPLTCPRSFDCFWMRGHHWCDFAFDTVAFPDPEGFIGRLKSRGLKVCVWINPYIAQESALFAEGDEEGYFLKRVDGSTWQTDKWQAGMAIVDCECARRGRRARLTRPRMQSRTRPRRRGTRAT